MTNAEKEIRNLNEDQKHYGINMTSIIPKVNGGRLFAVLLVLLFFAGVGSFRHLVY